MTKTNNKGAKLVAEIAGCDMTFDAMERYPYIPASVFLRQPLIVYIMMLSCKISAKTLHQNLYWHELANILGFATEKEMFFYLIKDQSLLAISQLLGFHWLTIRYRMMKLGIKMRNRGGRHNNQDKWWDDTAKELGYLNETDMLVSLRDQKKTLKEVGKLIGKTDSGVRQRMIKLGIERGQKGRRGLQ